MNRKPTRPSSFGRSTYNALAVVRKAEFGQLPPIIFVTGFNCFYQIMKKTDSNKFFFATTTMSNGSVVFICRHVWRVVEDA